MQKNDSRRWPWEGAPSLREIAEHPGAYSRWLKRRVENAFQSKGRRAGTAGVLLATIVMLGVLLFWAIVVFSVPTVSELEEARYAQATTAFTADGEELTRYQTRNHMRVSIDEIAPYVVEALIATEDRRFYDHGGIDLRRTIGSGVRTAQGDRQGGSTITMQLARNAFPEFQNHFILRRKVEEWLTAREIERMYGKDEILEMYLNAVPFMYEAFGIEAGARTYFQKSAAELDVLEASMLVGMLKGTVYYNPHRNPERAHERRNVVLGQMTQQGFISEAEYAELRDQETVLNFHRLDRADNRAPFFAEYLRLWLDEWAEENGYNLYTSGLQIHTTIDSRMQEAAERAVQEVGNDLQAVADVEWSSRTVPLVASSPAAYHRHRERVRPFGYFWQANPEFMDAQIRRSERYRNMIASDVTPDSAMVSLRQNEAFIDSIRTVVQHVEGGMVAIHPRSGEIKAWVGGRDFKRSQYDHVALSKRQPGSTFKPFVYIAALEHGFSPDDRIRDEVRGFNDGTGRTWRPTNVSGSTGSMMTLTDGLALSKNTITAQLTAEVTPGRVIDTARRMGIESELEEVLSLGLGTSNVSLLEMTAAYATIANGGEYRAPKFVDRIEDREGNVLARFRQESRRALDSNTAYTALDMMRGVVNYGTGQRIRSVYGARGDLAGKTGTTQRSADGWFMLMHPDMVVGSWAGFDNPVVTFRSSFWGQGSRSALPMAGTFVRDIGLSDARFSAPPGYRKPSGSRTLSREVLTAQVDSLYRDTLNVAGSRARADSLLYDNVEDQGAADELNRSQRVSLQGQQSGNAQASADTSSAQQQNDPSGQGGW